MTVCCLYPIFFCVLTLISTKANGRFKIPNREVRSDWGRWILRDTPCPVDILQTCVDGPVSNFEAKWPDFMQELLHPKLVAKSRKTPESIYHVFFLGLMHSLGTKGWEVTAEARAGVGYVDIRLVHKQMRKAVLIELKSSEKKKDMENDAEAALTQIIDRNYRNPLTNIETLREYGISCSHLNSHVKGRYLVLDQQQWAEVEDPEMSV
jgi:hypothetical protein